MDAEMIRTNIAACRARIDAVAREPVTICAVSKTMPAEIVNLAYGAGIRLLGENRVQELTSKFPSLNPGYSVDLIGQLQTNKVKYIMDCVRMVQSLDRMPLAQMIDRQAKHCGRVMPCLIEINQTGDPARGGVAADALVPFLRAVSALDGLAVRGLMAVMPLGETGDALRLRFRAMRALFERVRAEAIDGVSMEILSMGMSEDFEVAVQEGANLVRLGSAIFGRRTAP